MFSFEERLLNQNKHSQRLHKRRPRQYLHTNESAGHFEKQTQTTEIVLVESHFSRCKNNKTITVSGALKMITFVLSTLVAGDIVTLILALLLMRQVQTCSAGTTGLD